MVNQCDTCDIVEGCLHMASTYDEFLMNMTADPLSSGYMFLIIFLKVRLKDQICMHFSSFSPQLLLVNNSMILSSLSLAPFPGIKCPQLAQEWRDLDLYEEV